MSVMITQRYMVCLKRDILEQDIVRDKSDNECDDTQRHTACLKRDIFERDMSDNECEDTPAIHSVSHDIFE
jgi:hypothetical protein